MINKEFAKTVLLNKKVDNINDYLYKITENCLADIRESWESFIEDKLYQLYEKEGFTKVLQISKQDFRAFLIWALPKYKQEVLNNDK